MHLLCDHAGRYFTVVVSAYDSLLRAPYTSDDLVTPYLGNHRAAFHYSSAYGLVNTDFAGSYGTFARHCTDER